MSTIHPGLVSITFRKLTPRQVVEVAAVAGLTGIEWGGDVHVPHGDLVKAAEVRKLTADAGLVVPSYGSYYKAGVSEAEGLAFERVLETACLLGAPMIRVWAGGKGSAETEVVDRVGVVADGQRIATLAAQAGVGVACEYHGGSLTDTDASTVALLSEVGHNNFRTYWQPRAGAGVAEALMGMRQILPKLAHLHVFHWWPNYERRPLSEGTDRWLRYLELAATVTGDRFALLEFVVNDDPAMLAIEAATLKKCISQCGGTIQTE